MEYLIAAILFAVTFFAGWQCSSAWNSFRRPMAAERIKELGAVGRINFSRGFADGFFQGRVAEREEILSPVRFDLTPRPRVTILTNNAVPNNP